MNDSVTARPLEEPLGALHAIVGGDRGRTKLVIFVHGYDGHYSTTWGSFPRLLQLYADGDSVFTNWDFCFVGYSTYGLRSAVAFADELRSWIDRAVCGAPPFRSRYDAVVLVGHSLGTLVIRHLLLAEQCNAGSPIASVRRAILIGEPALGSSASDFLRLLTFPFVRKPVLSELSPGNGFIRQLANWGHCSIVDALHPVCPVYVYSITSDIVAIPGQLWATDIAAGSLPGDHVSAVQVYDWNHPLTTELRSRLP